MGGFVEGNGGETYLDRVESKIYERLLSELDEPGLGETFKLLNVLDRLHIV